MSKGVFTFEGGTDRLIELMQEELLRKRRRRAHQVRRREDRSSTAAASRGVDVNGRDDSQRGPSCRTPTSRPRSFNLVGEEHFDRKFRRRGPGRAAQQLEHQVYMALKPGETIDESTGRSAVQLDGAAVSHRAAAEPRHHQPHVFVLLSADAARQRPLR